MVVNIGSRPRPNVIVRGHVDISSESTLDLLL
jgi:hypothetical protein